MNSTQSISTTSDRNCIEKRGDTIGHKSVDFYYIGPKLHRKERAEGEPRTKTKGGFKLIDVLDETSTLLCWSQDLEVDEVSSYS